MKVTEYRRLAGEFGWVGLGEAVSVLGMLVGVRLLTGVLEPTIYGELALGMTAVILIQQVITGPLGNASLRYFSAASESGELRGYLGALSRLATRGSAIILGTAALICLGLFVAGLSRLVLLAIFAFIFALASGWNSILDGIQNAARQRTVVAWHSALSSWGRFLVAAGLILWLGPRSYFAMMGYVLASVIVLFSQTWFFKRRIKMIIGNRNEDPEGMTDRWSGRLIKYAWPFASWGIFSWAQLASGRWALELFASTESVGLFAVIYQLGFYPMTIVAGLVFQFAAPIFFQHAGDASDPSRLAYARKLNSRLVITSVLATGLAFLACLIIGGPIFRLIVDKRFHSAVWLLPGLVLTGGLFAVGQFCSISQMISSESRRLVLPKIGTAIIGLLSNLIGAYWAGLRGVVLAGLLTSVVYMVWMLLASRSETYRVGHNLQQSGGAAVKYF